MVPGRLRGKPGATHALQIVFLLSEKENSTSVWPIPQFSGGAALLLRERHMLEKGVGVPLCTFVVSSNYQLNAQIRVMALRFQLRMQGSQLQASAILGVSPSASSPFVSQTYDPGWFAFCLARQAAGRRQQSSCLNRSVMRPPRESQRPYHQC
jgi:hypothetical protein